MARMTREERRAQDEQERVARSVEEFKQRVARERRKQVYSDRAAWEHDDAHQLDPNNPLPRVRSGAALYEMVSDFRRTREQLQREVGRVQERMAEMLQRLEQGETRPFGSTVLYSSAGEIEMLSGQLQSLANSIARMAWATNWHVPEILPVRAQRLRDVLVSLDVQRDCRAPGCEDTPHSIMVCGYPQPTGAPQVWRVMMGDRPLSLHDIETILRGQLPEQWDEPDVSGPDPVAYPTEQDAWVAAMLLVGERP